jgi:hypothetical protein
MAIILLGHGHIEAEGPAEFPASVVVPPGTSVSLFAPLGSQLQLPVVQVAQGTGEHGHDTIPNYDIVKDYFLSSSKDTRGAGDFILNYYMTPLSDKGRELANHAFPKDEVVTPSGSEVFRLCTGTLSPDPETPGTCPTRTGDDRPHACDGILGKYGGKGELYWIACTEIDGADVELVLGPGFPPLPDGLWGKVQKGQVDDDTVDAVYAYLAQETLSDAAKSKLASAGVTV